MTGEASGGTPACDDIYNNQGLVEITDLQGSYGSAIGSEVWNFSGHYVGVSLDTPNWCGGHRKTIEVRCDKRTTLTESSYDGSPKGWEMDHVITLELSESVPRSVSATVSYDVENGTYGLPTETDSVTFSAYSLTSSTLNLGSHNDGCHSLGYNSTAGHQFLYNWSIGLPGDVTV